MITLDSGYQCDHDQAVIMPEFCCQFGINSTETSINFMDIIIGIKNLWQYLEH